MEREKRIILIGRTGCGKTTLMQAVEQTDIVYRKTQTVCHHLHFIDTPGEYLENRGFYKALIVSSYDADVIGFVQDCSRDDAWLPPMFASVFSKEVVGIVTKTDLASDPEQIRRAEAILRRAGVGRIFRVSSVQRQGTGELAQFLRQPSGGGQKTHIIR